jgi:hypothetical protein
VVERYLTSKRRLAASTLLLLAALVCDLPAWSLTFTSGGGTKSREPHRKRAMASSQRHTYLDFSLGSPPSLPPSDLRTIPASQDTPVWTWILQEIVGIAIVVICLSGIYMVIRHGLRTHFVCPYCAHEVRLESGFMVNRRARAFGSIYSRRSRSQRLLAGIRLTALKLRRLFLRFFRSRRRGDFRTK